MTEEIKQVPLTPTITHQEDLVVEGQRKVNLIWEFTQSILAIVIVLSNVTASLYNVFNNIEKEIPTILSSALFMVLGFYLARTNHQAIGGLGNKPTQEYIGR